MGVAARNKAVTSGPGWIGGWRQSDAAGRTLSSLSVGYYGAGKLIFARKLGTGFPRDVERDLLARWAKLGPFPKPPFAAVLLEYFEHAVWVRPELVVEGEFTTWIRRQTSTPGRDLGGAGGQAGAGGAAGNLLPQIVRKANA
jgi:hypothetical protein